MNTKAEKIKNFDANGIGIDNGNFIGLPFEYAESDIVIIPVPWDVTVSYNDGTSSAPFEIQAASLQVDLHDHDVKDAWQKGLYMFPIDDSAFEQNKKLRKKAKKVIRFLEKGESIEGHKKIEHILDEINTKCERLHDDVYKVSKKIIEDNKLPVVLGGDHSTPYGLIKAISEKYNNFGILQIDAHCDLRKAYEGFTYSHASIMYNVIQFKNVKKLVQVGIRDYCEDELHEIKKSNGRITTFFDADLKTAAYEGKTWKIQCEEIVKQLPQKVYLSFDIDGLDSKLCPGTGTPVAGGLEYHQAVMLIKEVWKSGRTIIGLDLNEVCSKIGGEWNANVGARMLYKLCNVARATW